MANVGYATLQIIPSAVGFQKRLQGQVAGGMAATGMTAGKQMGAGVAAGTAASSGLISKGMSKAAKGGLAALGALAYGTLNASGNFEAAMNQVRAVSGATGEDFDALRNQAKDLGSTTKFSASQAAEGMGFLAMAGFETKEILGAMPDVLNLAAAANMDLGRAADITSNILTGYGLKTRELGMANDVLVKAMTSANVDLGMLGESFKYVGPVAKSAGVSFHETAAAIGLMGDAGIQGGMAGTALRGAITRLLNPVGAAKTVIADLGLKATDSKGNLRSLADIVGELDRKGASTAQIMALFGQRAGPAMQALVDQGAGALRRQTAALEDSGGVADRVAKTQMEGLKGATTELKSAFEGLFITLGDKGPLSAANSLVRTITGGVQGLTRALEGGSGAGGRFSGVFDSIRSFAAPLWATLKGIGQDVKGVLVPAFSEIGSIFTGTVLPAFQAFLPAVQPVANFILKILGTAVVGVLRGVVNVVKGVLKTIAGVFNVFAGLLTGDWSRLWNGIKQIAKGVFDVLKGAIQIFWNGSILAVFRRGAAFLLKGIWTKLWSGIKSLASKGMSAAKNLISSAWSAIKGVFSKALSAVVGFVKSRFALAVKIVRTSMTFARSFLSGAWNAIRSLIANAVSGIVARVKSGFTSLVSGVRQKIGDAVALVKSLPGKALSALSGIGSKLISAGSDLIGGFIAGIRSRAGDIISTIRASITDKLPGFVKKALGINSPSRVFMEIGGFTAEGMAIGLERGAKRVSKAANALVAVPDASARAGVTGGSAGARALIENLTLQGSGNVHDDLDEVFFHVRHYERGGR